VDKTEKGIKVVSTQISRLDELEIKKIHKVEINLKYPLSETTSLQKLRSVILSNNEGEYPLYLRIFSKGAETLIATGIRISRDNEIINSIEEITGKGTVIFQ
jgi:hypothetical protein